MREVTFEEYIKNKHTYKNGEILPMAEHTIRRIGKLYESQIKAEMLGKNMVHIVEVEHKETPSYITTLLFMQTITLGIVIITLFFKG